MAHAEKCPVCHGRGYVTNSDEPWRIGHPQRRICHGCGGRGFVTVRD